MGFQIHNPQDEPIDIKKLDADAAFFWEKPIDGKYYASPAKREEGESNLDFIRRESCNWFDTIGYQIHNPTSDWTSGWANVKASLWLVQAASLYQHLINPEKVEDTDAFAISIEGIRAFLKPYFELIDYWAAKGYKPVQIKE